MSKNSKSQEMFGEEMSDNILKPVSGGIFSPYRQEPKRVRCSRAYTSRCGPGKCELFGTNNCIDGYYIAR